jgi:hypothetical protein
MDSKVLVIPRLINKVLSVTDSGSKEWNKEVIFERYGECLQDDSGGTIEVSFVGPYRFMVGGHEKICEQFEPSAILMESYLCTMLKGARDDALITQIMAQIQLDNSGFDCKYELAGVMDGYYRKKGARRLFLLWHMKTPNNWEVISERHSFKTPESQLGCFTVYEEMFQKEANANREIRDTVSKHLPVVGKAHKKLVDRHEGLQQRVE